MIYSDNTVYRIDVTFYDVYMAVRTRPTFYIEKRIMADVIDIIIGLHSETHDIRVERQEHFCDASMIHKNINSVYNELYAYLSKS
jgi:hypothetical protein